MKSFNEFLITYNSLITLALLSVAYFVKRKYDLKTKKIETHYSFFQQNKVNAVKSFFENYNAAERMWHAFPVSAFTGTTHTAAEIDKIVWPHLNAVKSSIVELNLYFNEKQIRPFQDIYDSLMLVQRYGLMAFFDRDEDNYAKDNFETAKERLKHNDAFLKEIGVNVRKSFHSDE